MYRLTDQPIDVETLQQNIRKAQDGAVVVFLGTVRNHARGRIVRYLEYHAYEPMALKKLAEIGNEAKHRYPISDIVIVHRLGRMEHCECSVAIVVTAPHRGEAFEASRFAIDTLKQIVPIWKKEVYEDGESWIEGA